MGESARNSLPQVVVIQVKLGESGEGRDGRRDRTRERVRGEITAKRSVRCRLMVSRSRTGQARNSVSCDSLLNCL
jgi:hypothetical protein